MLAVEPLKLREKGGGVKKKEKVKENNTKIEREIKSKRKSESESERERGGEIAKRDGAENEPSEAILSLDS